MTSVNANVVLNATLRTSRCCSHCGEEGHTIRSCNDDRIREFETECARRVQHYTNEEFIEFLNTEFETEPTLIRAFAMKKCRATSRTRKEELVRSISEYIHRTYVYGARDIYDAFTGHSAFSEREEQDETDAESLEVTDIMVRSMSYALMREMLIYTLMNNIRDEPNNNKLNIISSVNNDENEDINQLCECGICYEEKKVAEHVKLNCNHEFCKDCIINTIKSRQNANNICCAFCRTEVKSVESRTNEVKAKLGEYIE